jgi:glycine/D-amino acid oxidase-like deaminating enzyme
MTLISDYGSKFYWQETAPWEPRPALEGTITADVAIVGGGYTGLWTAHHLLEADPSLRVVVLEAQEVGFGASGRNGGFAMTLLDMSLTHLRRNHGDEQARAAHLAVAQSVEEIGQTIERHGIDCEWVHGGLTMVATSRPQLERVEADLETADALGLTGFRRLSAEEVQADIHSPTYIGGLHEDHCGVLHPARLARGLARVVEGMGATLHDTTPVTGFDTSGPTVRLTTPRGEVRADQVVLATSAWASQLPWFRRRITPLYTYIALTEPLTDAQWDSVGWTRRQGVEDKRNFIHYYRRTADGRILWGGSDGIIYPGGGIRPEHDRSRKVLDRLTQTFRHTFPQLDQVRFSHHWGGPVGITGTLLPIFGTLGDDPRIHYGLAYNGHGVAPTHTGGKVLRDKVLGAGETEYTSLCFVDAREPGFPPEPVRWMGAELTRRSLLRQDARFDRGKGSGDMDPVLLRVLNRFG